MKKFLRYLLLLSPFIVVNIIRNIYIENPILYWALTSFLPFAVIFIGFLLIFAPQKVLEIHAWYKGVEKEPFEVWSRAHINCLWLGPVLILMGLFYLYTMIQDFPGNVLP
jgi:uncharacterized membrane protein